MTTEDPDLTHSVIETVEGRDVTIAFEAKRCIHARICVLQQPDVFKANVKGPWIAPDEATTTEGLVAVAQNCPSGAIQYKRHDGGPEEAAPPVNLAQVRENGPLALRGDLSVDGASDRLSRDALPVRHVAEQTLLRQRPQDRRIRGDRGAGSGRCDDARTSRRPCRHSASARRPAGRDRQSGSRQRHGPDHPQGHNTFVLPLRRISQQALL